jgi:hypothetical protein
MGDLGIAYNLTTGEQTPFIVADLGPPKANLGEVSIKLAEGLGGHNVNPRDGKGIPSGRFAYIVFPNTHAPHPWPRSAADIAARIHIELDGAGGQNALLDCVR